MLWFRTAALSLILVTFLFGFGILWSIFQLFLLESNSSSMEQDPLYNGTTEISIIIIFLQLCMCFAALGGVSIGVKMWINNYQLDQQLRRLFTIWLCSWAVCCLLIISVAIFAITKQKESHHYIPYLHNVFTRMATETKFVAMLEKIQRESNCCGIYGPDDWLMAQRSAMGGNGGGGFGGGQSLDYGFNRPNPSTGHCHLTPPTIPMGCGKKILEKVYVRLTWYAGFMIVEVLMGAAAGVMAWYCFFYWLDKDVIVIPEDEISNVIVVEPESSTSTTFDAYGGGGYLPPGGLFPANYIPPDYVQSRMPGPSYLGYPGAASFAPHPSVFYDNPVYGSQNQRGVRYTPLRAASRYKDHSVIRQSRESATAANRSNGQYRDMKDTRQSRSMKSTAGNSNGNRAPVPVYQNHNLVKRDTSSRSRGPKNFTSEAKSRLRNNSYLPSGSFYPSENSERGYSQYPMSFEDSRSRRSYVPQYLPPPVKVLYQPPKEHSYNHMLHKQEVALGGRVVGEMHVDHTRDPDPMNPQADTARGERGHRDHHATLAIVRNKAPPEAKSVKPKRNPR